MASSASEPTWSLSNRTSSAQSNVMIHSNLNLTSSKTPMATTKGKTDLDDVSAPPPPPFHRRVTCASPIPWEGPRVRRDPPEGGKGSPDVVMSLRPFVRPFFPIDGIPPSSGVLRRVTSIDTFSIDQDDDDQDIGSEDDWQLNIGGHNEVAKDAATGKQIKDTKHSCRIDDGRSSTSKIGRLSVVEDNDDADDYFDEIMDDLIDDEHAFNATIPGGEEHGASFEGIADSGNGMTTSYKRRCSKGYPVRFGGTRLSTPPASPTHNHHADEEPPMVTPDETPLAIAVVGESARACSADSSTPGLVLVNSSENKSSKNNNKKRLAAVLMDDGGHGGNEDALPPPPALLSECPFPVSMKPILRILLYLDENCLDRDKVRNVFDIVHQCYKKHQDGDKKYRQLEGAIFEALIEAIGEELAESIHLSQSYESPRLENLFRSPSGKNSASRSNKTPRKNAPKNSVASGAPTMIELAIAYGVHFALLHPNVHQGNLEEQVLSGARTVESMSETEQQKVWARLMKTPLSQIP